MANRQLFLFFKLAQWLDGQQLASARFAAFLITPVFAQKTFSLLVYSYVALVYSFLLCIVSLLDIYAALLHYFTSLLCIFKSLYYIYFSNIHIVLL